jgi:hypothetical protein
MANARDTSGSNATGGGGETSNTVPLTLASGDSVLVAVFSNRLGGGDTLSGITWNGVAMTLAVKFKWHSSVDGYIYIYYMLNPASGSHNLVASFSSAIDSTFLAGFAYSGTNNASFPDNSVTVGPTSSSPITGTLTPTVANSWTLFACANNSGFTAESDTVVQSTGFMFVTDSNGVVTGSKSMTGSFSSDSAGGIMISIAPAVSPPLIKSTIINQAVKRASYF